MGAQRYCGLEEDLTFAASKAGLDRRQRCHVRYDVQISPGFRGRVGIVRAGDGARPDVARIELLCRLLAVFHG